MRLQLLLVVLLLSANLPAAADESENAAAFGQAWQTFLEVKQNGTISEQIDAAKSALDLGTIAFGESDDRVPALMTNYGATLYGDRQYEASKDVLAEALERAENIHGKKSERIISYIEKLAEATAATGSGAAQRKLFRRARKIASEQYGEDSIAYGDFAYRAGVSIFTLGRSIDGRRYLQDAAEIFQANPDSGFERNAMTAFWLGKIEVSERHNKKATEYLLQALDGFESVDDPMTEYKMAAHGHLVYTYETQGMSAAATEHCLAIGKQRGNEVDADYLPVFRLAPKYPIEMLTAGRQGYVDVGFTVDESGFVREAVAIKRKGLEPFEEAAIAAVERFRYAPRFENGKPVAVAGVETRITFEIQ